MNGYNFKIPAGNGQILDINFPEEDLRQCPCGSDLFDLVYKVGFMKPAMILNGPVVTCRVEIYLCHKCGYELNMMTPTKKEVMAGEG